MFKTDSKNRLWFVSRENGLPNLEPVGHNTNPDSADLSMEDYKRLCDSVPEKDNSGFDDPVYDGYDKARDRYKERMIA